MNTPLAVEHRLLDLLRADDFAGWDPFDSLNSRVFAATPLARSGLARLAFIQAGKRSPVNLRRLLAVPKVRNPKGIGLVILALLEDWRRAGKPALLNEAIELGDWLLGQCCDREVWHHACWGYPFDWQARAFYVPRGRPNVITTTYVARALLALGDATGQERFIETAIDAGRFVARHLQSEDEGGRFFAYIPGENAFVHNASLWGAAMCGIAGARADDGALIALGLQIADRSVRDQAADGSWIYGTRPHHRFIDSFHTGYNLEALWELDHATGSDQFADAIRRGLAHYKDTFIESDGRVRYYDSDPYPLDTHCVAQAIITLEKVGRTAADQVLSDRVLAWALRQLYDPRTGLFLYQRGRRWANRIPYMRWTQAWACYALAFHNRLAAEKEHVNATD